MRDCRYRYPAEVASALSCLVRIGLLEAIDAASRLADFDVWRAAMSASVEMHASDARVANIYARRFELKLRAPDALHLAIARRVDAALITLDRRLASAARALDIMVEEPA